MAAIVPDGADEVGLGAEGTAEMETWDALGDESGVDDEMGVGVGSGEGDGAGVGVDVLVDEPPPDI